MELDTGSPVSLLTALMYPEPLPSDWQLKVEQASMVLEPVMFRNWVTAGAEAEDASGAKTLPTGGADFDRIGD